MRKIDSAATQGGALTTLVARDYLDGADAWGRVVATLKPNHRQPE